MFILYIVGTLLVTRALYLKTRNLQFVLRLSLISLLLNLIWETVQMFWYQGYTTLGDHIQCIVASYGDMLAVLSIYYIVSFVQNNWNWAQSIDKRAVLITILLGTFLAIVLEQRAQILGLWSYTNQMPIIPFFHVGLLPVLQMMLLPLASFAIVHKLFPIRNGKKL